MPDATDVTRPDEQMGLAEGDAAIDQLSGAGNDKSRHHIGRSSAADAAAGILDCKVMQVELRLDCGAGRGRFEQPDPDHVAGLLGPLAGLLDRNVGDTPAVHIGAGGDHARGLGRSRSRNLARRLIQPQDMAERPWAYSPCCWPVSAVGSVLVLRLRLASPLSA